MPRGPLHFFLRNEFGEAPANDIPAVACQAAFGTADRVDHEQILGTDERYKATLRAHRRIQFALRGRGQPSGRAIQRCDKKIAIERNQ